MYDGEVRCEGDFHRVEDGGESRQGCADLPVILRGTWIVEPDMAVSCPLLLLHPL